jgi:outer membrane protein assembly factor BamA
LYLADIFSSKNIARDLSWRRLTHLHSGVFAPRFFDGGRRVIYNYHRLYGYDIGEIPVDAAVALGEASEPELDLVAYPGQSRSYQNLTGIEYSAKYALKPDIFFLTFGYSKYGLVGFSQMHFSDMLGDEDVYTTLEYSDEDNGPNFQLHYSNKKHRLNWLWGIFREKNFLNVITLANLNEIFYNSSFGTMSLYRYGVYGGLAYPLSKFFRWEGRVTTSRYEEKFLPGWPKEDVSGNLHQVNSGLVFDNTVWGRGHPIYGWRSYIMVEQSLPASPESIELGRLEGDVRRYFALNRRYSLAFRLRGGTLWGEDHGAFLYSLGGYNTIRGHPYRAYYGRHMWLFNAEFRFPFVKKLELGFPPISIGGISGVMFLDMGSVWTGEWHPMEQSDNTFRDIKAGYGMGLRLVVLPFIILRLDFATPWDGRHSKPMKKWDGMFSIGFDY